jgi:GrpB-like predicted nucleotidyltransferase (UPF0157 family)
VGVDPRGTGDPWAAWLRLHERFGTRATLLDLYALVAASRRIAPEELPHDERMRLARDVLTARSPGLEFVEGSRRPSTDPIEVVPYDPAWPDRFAEWRRKLVEALGPAAIGIEHIGSTAVPQLAAKPVIDIQIGVPDLEDEDTYVPQIQALGVALRAREPHHRYFRPAGSIPRTVQIHVYRTGSHDERIHLLFRDFMRARARERDAYERMKLAAAKRYPDDRIAYNEAKTGFILDALARAERWAADTGWRPGR